MILHYLDVETTDLDGRGQLLQLACIRDDLSRAWADRTEFSVFIDNGNNIFGHPVALKMNAEILKHPDAVKRGKAFQQFWEFLRFETQKIVFCGKNIGKHDYQYIREFLEAHPEIKWSHRFLDVGSLYFDPRDDGIRSLGDCLGKKVTHDALEDCRAVGEAIRSFFGFSEWENPLSSALNKRPHQKRA